VFLQESAFLAVIMVGLMMPPNLSAQIAMTSQDSPDFWSTRLEQRIDEMLSSLAQERQSNFQARNLRHASLFAQSVQSKTFRLSDMKAVLSAKGVPPQLVGIVGVESNFDNAAVSSKGAAGLWQLMPDTARRFGLVVNQDRDERFDPFRSTLAAASYLRVLYDEFHPWPLVFAAYNAGERRLDHALARAQGTRFWDQRVQSDLPAETRNYVRSVLVHMGDKNSSIENDSFQHSDPLQEMTRGNLKVNQSQGTGYVVFAETAAKP
jgi:membrane-bound lytic murein transglycosylase D